MLLAQATFHHFGILTLDIASTMETYESLYKYEVDTSSIYLPELKITVATLFKPECPRIELIEPDAANVSLFKMADNGFKGYHLAWCAPFGSQIQKFLEERDCRVMSSFFSPLWNCNCIFFITPDGQLTELIDANQSEHNGI